MCHLKYFMNCADFSAWLKKLQDRLTQSQHRQLVVLSGSDAWATSLLKAIPSFEQTDSNNPWVIYDDEGLFTPSEYQAIVTHKKTTKKNYQHCLGSQFDYVLFNAEHFNIDAFAALSGTLSAGGVFFLYWPYSLTTSELVENHPFLARFSQLIHQDSAVCVISQTSKQKSLPQIATAIKTVESSNVEPNNVELELGCKTQEQVLAVKAIEKVLTGHSKRPLILTADRGRGKSSALAIACAELLKNAKQALNIVICAPHPQALAIFFQQLSVSLPQANIHGLKADFCHQNLPNQPLSNITFVAIDSLLTEKPTANLVLIDEAAAFPVYLLEQVLAAYNRLVFATTLHGYEGAGRGFTLKFQQILADKCPQWRGLHINQAIRWADNDPLEEFTFNSCLLNARLTDIATENEKINQQLLTFQTHSKESLIADEGKLAQLFAVLVTAHYQTTPSDLQLMLDNQLLDVVSLSYKNTIVAVALLMHEGHCEQALVDGIWQGKRRLKNQFLPQSLMSHCGYDKAFDYSYLRIMRIAVHPSVQQQGIGQLFLTQISDYAKQQQIDFLGTSFGANATLLQFWLRANFNLARVGFTKDQASGEHSALLIKPLSAKVASIQEQLTKEFYRSFPYLLSDEYQHLALSLVQTILRHAPKATLASLTVFDQQNIIAFIKKQRLYSSCVYSLHLWLLQHVSQLQCNDEKALLLIARILQKHSIHDVCQQFQLSGKKALNQYLIAYLQQNYSNSAIDVDTTSA